MFFKWIKQHLEDQEAFYGTSENAVKTQIVGIAVSVYVAGMAIVRKQVAALRGAGLYQILQILSVTLFEKTPILQAFGDPESVKKNQLPIYNQLNHTRDL